MNRITILNSLQGMEGDSFTRNCTRFTCVKARGRFGLWVDRPNT